MAKAGSLNRNRVVRSDCPSGAGSSVPQQGGINLPISRLNACQHTVVPTLYAGTFFVPLRGALKGNPASHFQPARNRV
jgi:hypothetical protein